MFPLQVIGRLRSSYALYLSIILLFLGAGVPALAQSEAQSEPTAATKPAGPSPVVSDLNGVTLGMTADDVTEKLGKPDVGDDSGMFYTLSNDESLQLRLDQDKKVSMIAAIYSGKGAKAPEAADVFGPDGAVTPDTDGKLYKMVRYPKAGFWIAYSRLNLSNGAMTTVTIQKIDLPK